MTTIEYLTTNEINALLREISNVRDRAIISLLLNTGIFLNELVSLKTSSINWETKMVAISGNRQRVIPLNDQAFEALARWSKERVDSQKLALFLTNKGELKELSARSVEHLIQKYARLAGIKRRANALILRNTFAVRLFLEIDSKEKAAAILGITDPESINRYAQAAKQPPKIELSNRDLEKIDTRHALVKLTTKLFPTKPKIAKPLNEIKGPITPNPEEVIFGRDGVIEDVKANLKKGQSVLVHGSLGVGKTHLLKHMVRLFAPSPIYIASPSPLKNMLAQICDKLNPEWRQEIKTRATTKDIIDYIIKTKAGQPMILAIDNLNNLKSSDADSFATILEHFTILGAAETINTKMKQVWWKFKQIEVNPLNEVAAKDLIKYLTQNLSVTDYEMLENRVLSISNHLPLAIVDMIHQVSHKPVVNHEVIHEVYHEAGINYRDWTSAIVVLWGLAIMFRFLALGTHSFEGYIFAGFSTATLMVVRFFIFKMR